MGNIERGDILEKRKEMVFSYFKKGNKWYWLVLIAIAWLGYFIRTRSLPLLHDVTTGKYIPGPEADTYVFLRYVEYIVQNGHLMAVDCMRYYPWCYGGIFGGNMVEYKFLSYFIAYLYKFWHFFDSSITVQYAHIMYPVLSFVVALVFFFLLVKKLFDYKIALLASAFLTLVPAYLHRTMVGFSDKESLGFVFMFVAFYFFVCAWQNEKVKKSIILGALSGLSSGLMGLNSSTWMPLSVSCLKKSAGVSRVPTLSRIRWTCTPCCCTACGNKGSAVCSLFCTCTWAISGSVSALKVSVTVARPLASLDEFM